MSSDVSPTARALQTLEFLQSTSGATAGELAERLGVSQRAARRYLGILREAGISVESTRGPYGGPTGSGHHQRRHRRQSRVHVSYRSESSHEWQAEVDPWSVVVRHGHWYLLCHSHRAGAVRTYRVDRIQAVEQTSHPFVAPDGLDPVVALEENLGSGWEFPTRVVFEADRSEVAPWIPSPMGRLEAHPDGCVLVGGTSNPMM